MERFRGCCRCARLQPGRRVAWRTSLTWPPAGRRDAAPGTSGILRSLSHVPVVLRPAAVRANLLLPSRTSLTMLRVLAFWPLLFATAVSAQQRPLDVLLLNGQVLDGAGNPWVRQDVGIIGDRIEFVGSARDARVAARDTIDVSGLLVTPGFVDMHSHAELETPHGKAALTFLYQGITTVVIGVDGGGGANVRETFEEYLRSGMGVNALTYVGQGAARGAAMGAADRPPTPQEMATMKAFIRRGMEEGAFGMSTGLFYVPGYYARTDEG